jgi:hypothetical protein
MLEVLQFKPPDKVMTIKYLRWLNEETLFSYSGYHKI